MKHLNLCLAVLFSIAFFKPSHAQVTTNHQLLGSFVFNNNVFNYSYKLSGNGASSFSIDNVTGKKVNVYDVQQRIITIGEQTKSLKLPDSINISLNNIAMHLSSGFILLKKANTGIDSLIEVYNKTASDNLKKAGQDTLKKKAADSVAKAINLLTKDLGEIKDQVQFLEAKNEVNVPDFTLPVFRTFLPKLLSKYVVGELTEDMKTEIGKIADNKFIEIQARAKFSNDEPSTAYLKLLSDKVNVYFDIKASKEKKEEKKKKKEEEKKEKEKKEVSDKGIISTAVEKLLGDIQNTSANNPSISVTMKVEDVQFEFESGTIKNIYAEFSSLSDPQQRFHFQNIIPIGISGKFSVLSLSDNKIFAVNGKEVYDHHVKAINSSYNNRFGQIVKDGDLKKNAYFNLGELIHYILILENHKEDYSPDDKVYNLSPLQSTIELKKQQRSKILTLKAFSDFNGISGDKPNGLIQFEGNIHANISTWRLQINKVNVGFFTGADLLGSLNKIDNNNKYLIVNENNLDQQELANNKKLFRIQPIDLLRHQTTGVAISTNFLKIAFPNWGLALNANAGYGLMLSAVSDSLSIKNNSYTKITSPNQRSISSTNFNIFTGLTFSPDGRYGFNVNFGWNWLDVNNGEFRKADNLKMRVQTLEFGGFISTNSDSKLFFRWRKNSQLGDRNNNYNQIQIGYLVDVFKQSK